MQEFRNNTDSLQRLLKLEIDRAADRLIKVHGKKAFTHAARKVDVAHKRATTRIMCIG